MTASTAHITGLMSLACILFVLLSALWRHPLGVRNSISRSIAESNRFFHAAAYVLSLLAVVLVLSILYGVVIPFGLGYIGVLCCSIALGAMLVVAWAPAHEMRNKRLRDIHFAAGQILGIALLAIAATALPHFRGAVAFMVAALVSLCLGIYLLYWLFGKWLSRYFLVFEITFGFLLTTLYTLSFLV